VNRLGLGAWESGTLTEAEVDRRVLVWIGRFRFVTAALVAERFGVSVQMTGKRLARLEDAGMLTRERATHAEQYAVFLTPAGQGCWVCRGTGCRGCMCTASMSWQSCGWPAGLSGPPP